MHDSQKKHSFVQRISALIRRASRSDLAMLTVFFLWILAWLKRFLDMPYHWDSVGYVSHHTYNIYQHLFLPFVTGDYDVGHPTLIFWISAAAWRIFGVSLKVSHIIIYMFGSLLLLYTYKLGRRLGLGAAAFWAALMMSLIPLIASQTAQFQIDIPFTALFVGTSYYLLRGNRPWRFILFATALLLTKLTGIILLAPMMVWTFADSLRLSGVKDWKSHLHRLLPCAPPVLILGLFFLGRYICTGTIVAKFHSNQIAISSNLTELLGRARNFLYAVTFFNDAYILLPLTALALILFWRPGRPAVPWRNHKYPTSNISWWSFTFYGLITFLIYSIPHILRSFSGQLPRFFMVYLPFICLATGWAFLRFWRLNRLLGAGLFIIVCAVLLFHWHPKYADKFPFRLSRPLLVNKWVMKGDGSGECNFAWVDFVKVVKRMASYIEKNFPDDPPILAVFPEDASLRRPYNGYVTRPHVVHPAWTVEQSLRLFTGGHVSLCVRTSKSCVSFSMDPLVERVPLRLIMRYERRGAWCALYEKVEPSEKK